MGLHKISQARVGELWPTGQILPMACFGRTCKLRMVSAFLKAYFKREKKCDPSTIWPPKPKICAIWSLPKKKKNYIKFKNSAHVQSRGMMTAFLLTAEDWIQPPWSTSGDGWEYCNVSRVRKNIQCEQWYRSRKFNMQEYFLHIVVTEKKSFKIVLTVEMLYKTKQQRSVFIYKEKSI